MSRPSLPLLAVAIVGVAVFFIFLTQLLMLRYERGDIYPEGSTLRSDPLGARAYFEALQALPGFKPERGFGHLREELDAKPTTLFYLALSNYELPAFTEDEITQLDAYVRNGGRVVITLTAEEPRANSDDDDDRPVERKKKFLPTISKTGTHTATGTTTPADKKAAADKPDEADALPTGPMTQQEKYERDELRKDKEEAEKDGDADADPFAFHYHRSLQALWGFGTDVTKETPAPKPATDQLNSTPDDSDDDATKPNVYAIRDGPGRIEANVPWKSALFFLRLEPDWQIVYRAKSQPVFIRRAWGKGEIIVAGDSYFVSDEALRRDRCPALLSYLAGSPGLLLFDETHLGTQVQEGVMFLVNKFHLAGFMYALLGVLLLFVWRNSVPLVPPRPLPKSQLLGGAVSGKDSRSGLVNLLRRNIRPAQILPVSLTEWQRTATATRPHLKEKLAAMNEVLTGAEMKRPEQIVQLYHRLREISSNRPTPTHANQS